MNEAKKYPCGYNNECDESICPMTDDIKTPKTDEARNRHIEEIKAITEQIKRCESKHYYTQALPLRKRLKLLKTQLRVYDKEMGYQR